MSSPPTVQQGQRYSSIWTNLVPYITPPAAASVAIIPVFYGFIAKSAQQVGEPIPKMTIKNALKEGFKVSPTIGVIIGTQMIAQNLTEKALMKMTKNKQSNFSSMLVSSLIVGGISAPALAIFNGQTMGDSAMKTLRNLSRKQVGAIVSRESSFLFSLRISDLVSKAVKKKCGDNKTVEYSSAFFSGAIGSIIGHPGDTALTLWQKGMEVKNFRQLMRGSPVKALATGGFAVCYKFTKEKIRSLS